MKKFILKNKWPIIFLSLLSLISFIIYFRSLKVGFLSDDFFILFDWKQFMNPFSGNRWLAFQGLYYWLTTITGYHVLPLRIFFLLLFSLNIVLVFILTKKLTQQVYIAYLSAFIFALFYRQPMSIYWLAASHEILLMTFTLFCLILYLNFIENKKNFSLMLSSLFFVLALLTKESALIILPAIFLIDWLIFDFSQKKWKRTVLIYLPFIFISMGYLAVSFLSTSNAALVQRGGYHLVGLKIVVFNYANILAAFLPFRFDDAINTNFKINLVIIFGVILFSIILFFIKKIPRYIPLFLILILIISIPYAPFSPFGFQDKYLSLASFAFAGFIASLVWLIIKNFKLIGRIVLTSIFVISFGLVSIYLINYRSEQWLTADRMTEKYQAQFKPFCSSISEQNEVYLINYPEFINNQVFIYNNGLGDMINLTCNKKHLSLYRIQDQKLGRELRDSNEKSLINNNLILSYQDYNIVDYSDKWEFLSNYLNQNSQIKVIKL